MRKDETLLVWDEKKIPEAPFHIICNLITYHITLSLKTLGIKSMYRIVEKCTVPECQRPYIFKGRIINNVFLVINMFLLRKLTMCFNQKKKNIHTTRLLSSKLHSTEMEYRLMFELMCTTNIFL